METRRDEIAGLLERTRSDNPRVRWHALVHLCPCHVKRNVQPVWDRVIVLSEDPNPKVRDAALHVLTDGLPRSRETEVVRVLDRMRHDPDLKVRPKARKILATYRRTGDLNVS